MSQAEEATERLTFDLPASVVEIIRGNVESGEFASAEAFVSFVVLLYENAETVIDAEDLDVLQASIEAAASKRRSR